MLNFDGSTSAVENITDHNCNGNNSGDPKQNNKQRNGHQDEHCSDNTKQKHQVMPELRSPSRAELQNLKVYSPAEIENGKGKQPE